MNPGNFMNLFQNINSKVQEKISKGDIDENMLTGEAQNLYGNFQNNPMFQNMMNNPELKKFQEQMSGKQSGKQSDEQMSGEKDKDAVNEAKKNKSVRVEKLDENIILGIDKYNEKKYIDCIFYMNQIIEKEDELYSEALFWKAKANYELNHFIEAKRDLDILFEKGSIVTAYYEDSRFKNGIGSVSV